MPVNYLAILVAAIAMHVVGWLWYGPIFGKKWRMLMNVPMDAKPGPDMWKTILSGFVAALVTSFVLENLLIATHAHSTYGAVIVALWVWIGFVAAIMINIVIYEKRPWVLYFIGVFHYFFALLAAAIVLSLW